MTANFYKPEIEQKLQDSLRDRAILLTKAKEDKKLQAILMEQCKQDINFFFNNFLYTNKNDTFFSQDLPYTIPFILFDYQEDIVKEVWRAIVEKDSVFFEKSRQLGLTWVLLGIFMYGFLFHGHKYLIISRTANEVDKKGDINSCFGRLRFMLEYIPKWMLPEGFDRKEGSPHNAYMKLTRPDNPASITGESANPNAARGGTYNAIFMDEMAFMMDGSAINRSASQATPCRLMNSTPNGKFGEYFEMRTLAKEGKISGLTLHWSLHPFYTKKWYEWKTKGMTPEQIAQELEISYSLSLEGRVYKEFEEKPIGLIEVGVQFEYDYRYPVYACMDNSRGGNDPFAVILSQVTPTGKIQIFDSIQMKVGPTKMANFMAGTPTHKLLTHEMEFMDRFKTYKTPVFISDPYDTNAQMNDTTIMEEFRKVGICLNLPTPVKGNLGNVAEQIRITSNNLERIQIHPRCSDFVLSIQNSTYPPRKETSSSTSPNNKPIHNQFSHYRTAFEYLVLYITQNLDRKKKVENKVKIQVPNHVTGELETRWITV